MLKNVNETISLDSNATYCPPSWIHELRPSAQRSIHAIDSTATLHAVSESESDNFHREAYTGHLWSQTQKKKIPCTFHVFYARYQNEDTFHITIHLKQNL